MQRPASILAVIGVTLIAASGWAQVGSSAGERFVGQVTGQDVYVRSGPDIKEYYCAQVSKPTKVTVVGELGEWSKIAPVAGCFSVIRKAPIRPGTTGCRSR